MVEISDLKMWLMNLPVSFPSTYTVCTPHCLPHLPPLGLACTLTCERHVLGHQHPQQDILQHLRPRGRCPFWILLFKSFVHTNRAVCCGFEYAHSKKYVDHDLVLFPKAEKLPSSWGGHLTMESCGGYSSCSKACRMPCVILPGLLHLPFQHAAWGQGSSSCSFY